MTESEQMMMTVMQQEPQLNIDALFLDRKSKRTEEQFQQKRNELLTPESLLQFEKARLWFRYQRKWSGINSKRTSIDLAQTAQRQIGFIAQGIFIAAAIAEGFRCQVIGYTAYYDISNRLFEIERNDETEPLLRPKRIRNAAKIKKEPLHKIEPWTGTDNAEALMEEILENSPQLTPTGFNPLIAKDKRLVLKKNIGFENMMDQKRKEMLSLYYIDQFNRARWWFHHQWKVHRIYKERDSHLLMQNAEMVVGKLEHGTFIAAGIAEGFRYVSIGSLAFFNIGQKINKRKVPPYSG